MATITNDLSYFKLRLQELLYSDFPEKAWDSEFIEHRAALATDAYVNAFKGGNHPDECERLANTVLYEGLYFSRFNAVLKVVCNEFDTRIADEELYSFAMQMLVVCKPVFKGYRLTADFEEEPQYELLYTELTGRIANWIDENGLQ